MRGSAAKLAVLSVLWFTAPVMAATYTYHGYVGGLKAGHATVHISREDDRYEVSGTAHAEGIVASFGKWDTRFRATGQFVDGEIQPLTYHYIEKGDDKRRDVTVEDGQLYVIKNGKVRPVIPAFPGADILSALFFDMSCEAERQLHSGRHAYTLKRIGRAARKSGVCRYRVVDEEGERYYVDVMLGERNGHTVPVVIAVTGLISGRLILVDP